MPEGPQKRITAPDRLVVKAGREVATADCVEIHFNDQLVATVEAGVVYTRAEVVLVTKSRNATPKTGVKP